LSNWDKLSESELIELTINGNEAAFVQIVKLHQSTVSNIALNMLNDYNDAEEIGQKTFIKLYQSLNTFRKEASLKTYVSRIAINLCLNELKRRKRFWKRFEPIKDLEEKGKGLEYDTNKKLLELAIESLEPKFKAVIVLRNIQELSTSETAKVLKIPAGTVMSRQKRGLEKLKLILETKYKNEKR
jgi:RNA polymerase sigma-70 factor (ECF subfamily)